MRDSVISCRKSLVHNRITGDENCQQEIRDSITANLQMMTYKGQLMGNHTYENAAVSNMTV